MWLQGLSIYSGRMVSHCLVKSVAWLHIAELRANSDKKNCLSGPVPSSISHHHYDTHIKVQGSEMKTRTKQAKQRLLLICLRAWESRQENVLRSVSTVQWILNPGIKWIWVVSFTSRPLLTPRKERPRYPVNSLSLQETEPRFQGRQGGKVVTTLTEVPPLLRVFYFQIYHQTGDPGSMMSQHSRALSFSVPNTEKKFLQQSTTFRR